MGELTNKDLQDAFMEGFCYAEDIGHTTGKKFGFARQYADGCN